MTALLQTADHLMEAQNDLQKAIHRTHWQERADIINALSHATTKTTRKHALKLAACGQSASLYYDPQTDTTKTLFHRCRSRICPWCTHQRTHHAAKQITAAIGQMAQPRTIILTARSTQRPLPDQVAALRKAFTKLRRTKIWNRLVTGGIYTLEITYNTTAATWHPHLHLVVDGQYLPQQLLSKLWQKATGDSDIVWINAIKDPTKAALELAAYIGKPPKVRHMTPDAIREYAAATRGSRMLGTFGTLRNVPLHDEDHAFTPPPDSQTITVHRIRYLAKRGQQQAQLLAYWIPKRWPIFRGFFEPPTPDDKRPPRQMTDVLLAKANKAINQAFTELIGQQENGSLAVYDLWDKL